MRFRSILFRTVSLLLLVTVLNLPCVALVLQPSSGLYCTDDADVISKETETYILECGDRLYRATGAQIVIVTVPTLAGEKIADSAASLAAAWKIGAPDRENGILLLLSVGDSDYHAVQGRGLYDVISDARLADLLDTYLEPWFSRGEIDQGVRSVYDALYHAVCDAFGYDGVSELHRYEYETVNPASKRLSYVIVLLIIIFAATVLTAVLWLLSAISRMKYLEKEPMNRFWRIWYPLLRRVFWRHDRRRPQKHGYIL